MERVAHAAPQRLRRPEPDRADEHEKRDSTEDPTLDNQCHVVVVRLMGVRGQRVGEQRLGGVWPSAERPGLLEDLPGLLQDHNPLVCA